MEYNNPEEDIIKDLTFGGVKNMLNGVRKLSSAVTSTLGASGKCVIYEDATGKPMVTKDGVTVARSVVLPDPLENIGCTMVKEAAKNTVKEAGDGTTTSTALAYSILENSYEVLKDQGNLRVLKADMDQAMDQVVGYLDGVAVELDDALLESVAMISTNNDAFLGGVIADAFLRSDGGVVTMQDSGTDETFVEVIGGIKFDSKVKSPFLYTNKDKETVEYEGAAVLITDSPISTIRKIEGVLEHCVKSNTPLLIIGEVEAKPMQVLLANKVKGNIKVNVVDAPGFGPTRKDTLDDLAFITGAKVASEALGDTMGTIDETFLGKCDTMVTDNFGTILTVASKPEGTQERIAIAQEKLNNEKNQFIASKIEERISMLSGVVSTIKVGAKSNIELREKKDRIEDAIYAVKAAMKEGIVPGGGIALADAASTVLDRSIPGQDVIYRACMYPMIKIQNNAGISLNMFSDTVGDGTGVDVITGNIVNMIEHGIIDPLLVTKTALLNAYSVATTILSADCVISNVRQ